MSLTTFLGRQVSILWRSDPALRFNQKYLNFCSEDERKSYGVEQHEGESLLTEISFWGELSL